MKIKNLIHSVFGIFGLRISKTLPHIVEMSEKEREIIKIAKKYSMSTEIRMWALINSIKKVNYEKIEGDIVECGIWKGGNIILINKILKDIKLKKKIYCYDTFEGMIPTDEIDKEISSGRSASQVIKDDEYYKCESLLNETKKNISKNFKDIDNIYFIKGMVENTLTEEKNIPDKISICRLDTDYYSSTKIELEVLYPRLVPGGVMIIDDYGHWAGSKKAVDEFFKDKFVMMHYVDYACRLIIKN